MASNTITVNILGDASSALHALGRVDSESSRVGSALATAGKAMAGGVALAGTAFAGLTVSAVSMGLKTAASMETAKIGFETMLGSAEKADKFLGDLQQFAAKTPFEFPELQTAASSLISVGVQTKDVIPIMKTLGNVTSGMGTGAEGVQRATVALQQMSAAGRITGEDLNQLRDAGIPVFDLLAAATGKTKEEVAALAQQGKLGKAEMDQLFEALKTGKGLERFEGLMEKQSQSLSGLMSTMKDTVAMGLSDAVQPLMPMLSNALPIASSLAGAAIAKFGEILANVVKQAGNLWAVLRSGDDVAQGAAEILDNVFGNTGTLVSPIRELVSAAQDVWTVFRDGILPVFVDFYSSMPSFLTPLGLARDVLGFVADHAEALQPIMAALLGGFLAFRVVTGILEAVSAAQAILNVVMTANPIGIVVIALAGLVAGLVYAYNHISWFRDGVDAVFSFVADAGVWLANVFAGVWNGIVAGFRWVSDTLKTIANWLIANVYNRLIDAGNGVIRGLNIVNVGDDIPTIPRIPALAKGGIVTRPTLAMVGEAGPEAVVPLSGPGGSMGGGVTVIVQTGQTLATERDIDEAVRAAVERVLGRGGSFGNGRGASLALG